MEKHFKYIKSKYYASGQQTYAEVELPQKTRFGIG
jgi:hypothetical protein